MFIEKIPINSKIGIGPKLKEILISEEIFSIFDLLNFYPSSYKNYSISKYDDVRYDETIILHAKVCSIPIFLRHKSYLTSLSFNVLIENHEVKLMIFNRPFLLKKIELDAFLYIEGKFDKAKKHFNATNIYFKLENNSILANYTSKANQKQVQNAIKNAFIRYAEFIKDIIPKELKEKYRLIDYHDALYKIHFPANNEDLYQAKRRLKYEEFFRFELKLQYFRKINEQTNKKPKIINHLAINSLINTLPFTLTTDQKSVLDETLNDLAKSKSANRLIQGDVGSGKTVIAALLMYACYLDNYQSALMAPTEILAYQHYQTIKAFIKDLNIALLTSSTSKNDRKIILNGLKIGEIKMIIGTHSLIQEAIVFKHLGLVITDEQHRFGVNQRQSLRKKGDNPDVIYLTATPIPRSLALSLFGDMDISSIKSMPKGRLMVETCCLNYEKEKSLFDMIEIELKQNHQAYIIAPLIIESNKKALHDLKKIENKFKMVFPNHQIGILHGKKTIKEKNDIMERFMQNGFQILISTTVIEVGIDNPNATIMAIYNAEQFGLSQLHQLRGRVGRSNLKSYCFLISDKENAKRLKIMESTSDGFILSEEDLKLRGPGDFFGSKQSGMPKFKLGDVVNDYKILECAKDDAFRIIFSNNLNTFRYSEIKEYLFKELENSSILD